MSLCIKYKKNIIILIEGKEVFVDMIYKTNGVCASSIEFEVNDDNTVKYVKFIGGCSGNTQGISQLVVGMDMNDVISRLESIKCGFKDSSCPAQLAKALKSYKSQL